MLHENIHNTVFSVLNFAFAGTVTEEAGHEGAYVRFDGQNAVFGFSTKAQKGRGVGMRRIKEIVDSHGGTIDVDTEPGSGTTFTIIFSQKRGGRV